MAASRWQVKCPLCGHSRGKHTGRNNPGCTVRVWVSAKPYGRGRRGSLAWCDCPGYPEMEKKEMGSIGCDVCNEESAVMMQTNTGNGDTTAIGANCLFTWSIGMAQGMASESTAEWRQAHAEEVLTLAGYFADQLDAAETSAAAMAQAVTGATGDDGVSGNDSAGALTHADMEQIEAAATTTRRTRRTDPHNVEPAKDLLDRNRFRGPESAPSESAGGPAPDVGGVAGAPAAATTDAP